MITLENTIKENEKAFDKKAYKITEVSAKTRQLELTNRSNDN